MTTSFRCLGHPFPKEVVNMLGKTENSLKSVQISTVVPGFSVLGFRALPGFRALCTWKEIWIYVINLPGFSALPGFKASFHGDGQSALNPGTTVIFSPSNIFTLNIFSQISRYLTNTVVPGFSALCPSP